MESFILEVILITSTGALSPGPLTAATIRKGLDEGWKAGFLISVGHTIAEFSLVLAIAFGIAQILTVGYVKSIIGLIGGLILFIFGVLQLRAVKSASLTGTVSSERSSIGIGFFLSAFNPYFILWWSTVGLKLIVDALIYASFIGLILMYVAHVWMDYVWLILLCHLAFKGKEMISEKIYRLILFILALIMFIFAFYFVFTSICFLVY